MEKLTHAQQLDWSAARKAADRISRICDDATFTEPELLDQLHAKIVLVAADMDLIAKALLITPVVPS